MSKIAKNTNLVSKIVDRKPPLDYGELAEFEIMSGETSAPKKSKKLSIPKDLTRISIDREGKRALFSNATGAIADNMQQNTPEKEIKRPEVTVGSVLKDWEMFKTPNNDEIT